MSPDKPLTALFVHGMGRSPLSGYPLLRQLRRAGLDTQVFGYTTALHDFEAIVRRLAAKIDTIARTGEYIVIGHSLGGVMIRAALSLRPPSTLPRHVFLLASPVKASRLARTLGGNILYRIFTGDCGQLLGSDDRMASVSSLSVATTAIVGTRGCSRRSRTFLGDVNDGVVALNEVSADWITDQVSLPIVHTLLPSSRRAARVILDRVGRFAGNPLRKE